MALTNAPGYITALQSKLDALTSVDALGPTHYYPEVDESSLSVPAIIYYPESVTADRIAEGVQAIVSGTVSINVLVSATNYNIGQLETLLTSIATELVASDTGLIVSSAEWSLATPEQDSQTADEYDTMSGVVTISFGLGA